MQHLLVIDDDEATRKLIRLRLGNAYSIIDTGDPESAFATALDRKPDAILLDLSLGGVSGFELCKTFSSFDSTRHIPIFIITGGDLRNQAFCKKLGASGFFQKPIDFDQLSASLDFVCHASKPERRSEARIRMKLILKLKGTNLDGKPFEVHTTTEDISSNGFQVECRKDLVEGITVEVWLCNGDENYIGRARIVRVDRSDPSHIRYGFRLEDKTGKWVLE